MALWRNELINRAWDEMEAEQSATGPPYFAALWLKAEEPQISAADLARRLREAEKGDYTSAGIRQVLHRSREIFAEKLLAEVRRSILSDDDDAVAEELADLDLLTYCQQAMKRRRG
jgi:hypothetical protein